MYMLSFLLLFVHGTKSTIIWPLGMSIVAYHLSRSRISNRVILYALLVLLISFIIVGFLRINPSDHSSSSSFDAISVSIQHIFYYLCSGFVNLSIEFESNRFLEMGDNILAPIYDLFNFFSGNNARAVQQFDSLIYHPSFNTATFARDPLRDFGLYGLFLYSYIIGFLSESLYIFSIRTNNLFYVLVYPVFSASILSLFFSNQFLKVQYLFILSVLVVLGLLFPILSLSKKR